MAETSYLLTSTEVDFELIFEAVDDEEAVGRAYATASREGLKSVHLFRLDEPRDFVHLKLP